MRATVVTRSGLLMLQLRNPPQVYDSRSAVIDGCAVIDEYVMIGTMGTNHEGLVLVECR